MTQNTEQNVRTRDAQIRVLANLRDDVLPTRTGNAAREYAEAFILEAEARGAEEQRRKDGELSRAKLFCQNEQEASDRTPERPDVVQWQKERNEFFLSSTLEVVTEYAAWRDKKDAELQAENITMKTRVINAAENLLSIETPCMEGDNFAVTICSHFEDCEGETCDNGWHEGATKAYEEIKDAILRHFRSALTREGGV